MSDDDYKDGADRPSVPDPSPNDAHSSEGAQGQASEENFRNFTAMFSHQYSDDSSEVSGGGKDRSGFGRNYRDENWRKNPRFIALLLSSIIVVVLFFAALWVPVPYVVESPGPVFNVLGEAPQRGRLPSDGSKDGNDSENPIISIQGRETFPVTGRLDMTTVSVRGGPVRPINIFEVAAAWFDPNKAIIPQEQIYPPGSDGKEEERQNSLAFSSSQDLAVAAALEELGIGYSSEVRVSSVISGGATKGLLKIEDQIVALNDIEVSTPNETVAVLARIQPQVDEEAQQAPEPGRPVKVTYKRAGQQNEVRITPQFVPYEGRSRAGYKLGVALSPRFLFPFEVKFNAEGIGGPSAGMMFALSIVDKLTPEDLTGGRHVAGTGTISTNGQVGPIGGIKQKMVAAKDNGAELFLAPASNCSDVVGNVPQGLNVVKVDNLHEALQILNDVTNDVDVQRLPRCS